ncbi:hypothetical protein MHYP_G00221080 [Metynnis hypsauchen]
MLGLPHHLARKYYLLGFHAGTAQRVHLLSSLSVLATSLQRFRGLAQPCRQLLPFVCNLKSRCHSKPRLGKSSHQQPRDQERNECAETQSSFSQKAFSLASNEPIKLWQQSKLIAGFKAACGPQNFCLIFRPYQLFLNLADKLYMSRKCERVVEKRRKLVREEMPA